MFDPREEQLIAIHEVVELSLVLSLGVSQEAIDQFDLSFERERKVGMVGLDSEPGDDPRAPYHSAHLVASDVEQNLARELGVDWSTYCSHCVTVLASWES